MFQMENDMFQLQIRKISIRKVSDGNTIVYENKFRLRKIREKNDFSIFSHLRCLKLEEKSHFVPKIKFCTERVYSQLFYDSIHSLHI